MIKITTKQAYEIVSEALTDIPPYNDRKFVDECVERLKVKNYIDMCPVEQAKELYKSLGTLTHAEEIFYKAILHLESLLECQKNFD